MRKPLFAILILVILIASCSLAKNTDEENITMIINANAGLLLASHETGEPVTENKAEINTLIWYRESQDSTTYEYNITVSGDTAEVEIIVSFKGIFNQMYVNDSLDTVWLWKPFTDTMIRYARLMKDTVKDYYGGWRFRELTGAVTGTGGTQVSIDSVRLYKENIIDTVISDIYSYFSRDDIITLPAGESVELSIFTDETLSTFFVHSNLRRAKFINNGAYFAGTWNVPITAGLYRCIFDGIETAVFNDDSTEYSSLSWIIPYRAE